MRRMGAEKIVNAWNNSLPGLFPLLTGRTRWLDDLCCNAIKEDVSNRLVQDMIHGRFDFQNSLIYLVLKLTSRIKQIKTIRMQLSKS